MKTIFTSVLFGAMLLLSPISAWAEDYVLTLKDRKFQPEELVIPANQKVKLVVKNLDSSPAEFESYDINREKIIASQGQVIIYVGPLKPGRYKFFDDFHPETKGVIVVQ